MSAIISKATGIVNGLVTKTGELTNCAVYWSKVGAELGKSIYKSEGLAPPTQVQFQQVYQKAFALLKSPQQQKELLQKAAQFKPSKQAVVKASVGGIQVLAFFSVGEIIGRRSIFGYPSVGGAHH
jgi:F-type H+-transporting ATPase subunit g